MAYATDPPSGDLIASEGNGQTVPVSAQTAPTPSAAAGVAGGSRPARSLAELVELPHLPAPPWLEHKLTAESATQMLRDLRAKSPTDGPGDPAFEADAHAKRLALLVFAFGGDSSGGRLHCATPAFADAVAQCLEHSASNVRGLAIDTLGALASFDERLALPHVPRMMSRLADPEDALNVLAVLHADFFPAACRAVAAEASADAISAALAVSGADAFEANLAGLEACIELGPEACSRHAVRGDLARFLEPGEPSPSTKESFSLTRAPALGNALCSSALRVLEIAGATASAPHRDAIELWLEYEGDAAVTNNAERLVNIFTAADDALKARVLAIGTRERDEIGEGRGADAEDRRVGDAVMRASASAAATTRPSPMVT